MIIEFKETVELEVVEEVDEEGTLDSTTETFEKGEKQIVDILHENEFFYEVQFRDDSVTKIDRHLVEIHQE